MTNLDNKKVLLIAAKFFGYEKNIEDELKSRNADVDFIADRPFNSAFMKAFTKMFPDLTQFIVHMYYKFVFGYIFKKKYDYVFVVEGITLSRKVLNKLKLNNPTAKFILYVWDSVANRPHILDNKDCYDKAFTFDPEDAKRLDIIFRPLFFISDFECEKQSQEKYDISFVGTIHSDRYSIIKNVVEKYYHNKRRFIFLYFHAQWYYFFKKFFDASYRKSKKSDFRFIPTSKSNVANVLKGSLAILDIEHPSQVGLTIRTFEVLGAKRKLITTNKSIKDMDFYNPNNILVIDREEPIVPEEFILSPYEFLPKDIYEKYTIRGWVNEIFV